MDPQAIVLDKLQDDINYYGDYGKQFLSYSDIRVLFTTPNLIKQDTLKSKALIEGSYFHTAMLEPDRIKEYEIVDVASRSTKAYKEVCSPGEILLLRKEQEHLDKLVATMKDSLEMSSIIYSRDNKFEVPGTESIMNNMWKGKADIVTPHSVIDLKTTSNIHRFSYSFKDYYYSCQAWLYEKMFGKPMIFYVACKKTKILGKFQVTSDWAKQHGEDNVLKAIEYYNKYIIGNEKFYVEKDL